jgi:AcrR family transcriptional regulator
MPRAKQRTPELRDRLIRVAVGMLESDGVAAFTTRRVAAGAATSTPAVYELFGDKAGLVREIFFEGFRLLHASLDTVPASADPRADLIALAGAVRRFARDNRVLTDVMFSRPFADFDPAPAEAEAGRAVREFVTGRVQRAIDAGVLAGEATDNAHVLLALTLGLAGAENASRLGTSQESVDRRWALGIESALNGLAQRHG